MENQLLRTSERAVSKSRRKYKQCTDKIDYSLRITSSPLNLSDLFSGVSRKSSAILVI